MGYQHSEEFRFTQLFGGTRGILRPKESEQTAQRTGAVPFSESVQITELRVRFCHELSPA